MRDEYKNKSFNKTLTSHNGTGNIPKPMQRRQVRRTTSVASMRARAARAYFSPANTAVQLKPTDQEPTEQKPRPDRREVAVLDTQEGVCTPMAGSEYIAKAREEGHAAMYNGETTYLLDKQGKVSTYTHKLESKEAIARRNPKSPEAVIDIMAEKNRAQNEFLPTEMARTGLSPKQIEHCQEESKLMDIVDAVPYVLSDATTYSPSTGLGEIADVVHAASGISTEGELQVGSSAPSFTSPEAIRRETFGTYEACIGKESARSQTAQTRHEPEDPETLACVDPDMEERTAVLDGFRASDNVVASAKGAAEKKGGRWEVEEDGRRVYKCPDGTAVEPVHHPDGTKHYRKTKRDEPGRVEISENGTCPVEGDR